MTRLPRSLPALKVAMVSEHASPLAMLGGVDAGGQNVHVAALAAAMASRGAEVAVHTRRDGMAQPRRVSMRPGVVVDHVSAGPPAPLPKDDLLPHMAEFAHDLQRQWRRDPPDIVHAHFWMSGLAALEAARPQGIPVVQTFHALGTVKKRHQGAADTSPPSRLAIEQRIASSVDAIVATCSDEVFELLHMGAARERIRVVPCGVDLDLFTPCGPAEPRGPWRHRIVFVGRLVQRKGIGNAITALAQVPDTELVVAGGPEPSRLYDDDEVRRLRELARRCGVADRVSFRGRVGHDELTPLYRSADLVVCVPWYEPFGIVPLEAMACGVPVVASAVGGLVDTVVDGRTGVHIPPRSPEALAGVLNALLASPDRLMAMGAAGARRARSRYSWQRVASSTLQVYDELLASSVAAERVGTR